jgi:hypothetical protein
MLRYVLAAAAIGLVPSVASAQLVTNGGFEDPTISDPCCNTVPPDSLPGWTATPNVNVVNGTFGSTAGNLAHEDSQYLDLVGQGGTGSISQDILTTPGQAYNLTFAYSHNLFTDVAFASALVSIDGLAGIVTHSSGTNADLDWRIFSGGFVATGTTATLSFINLTGGENEGVFLDAVSLVAVPEPSTWMMMLVGFGAIGFAMRRKGRSLLASA